MKKILVLFIIGMSIHVSAQDTIIPIALLERYKQEINDEVLLYRQYLEDQAQADNYYDSINIEFIIDTFKIEQLYSKKMDSLYGDFEMAAVTYELEQDYDDLLNKYYKLLMSELQDQDKIILKESQRNWIAYRNTERKLNSLVSDDVYSGGGTMHFCFISSTYCEITKKRVLELYDYYYRVIYFRTLNSEK